MYRLLLFSFSLFSVAAICSCGDNKSANKINKDLLKNDFVILRKALEEGHPGLYWYSDKPTLNKFFDGTVRSINRDMSTLDFFNVLLPVIARVKCSHTQVRLPAGDASFRIQHALPFNFLIQDQRLYITKDFSGNELAGKEITTIDKIPVKNILQKLFSFIPADGFNQTYKESLLSRGAFIEAYAMLYGQPSNFNLNLVDSTGEEIKTDVAAVKFQTIQPETRLQKLIDLGFPNDTTALLSINSFVITDSHFRDTTRDIFKTLAERNIQKLIIDIRKNGGGSSDNISELYAHLAGKPFLHLRRAEMNSGEFTFLSYTNKFHLPANLQKIDGGPGKYLVSYRYAGTSLREPVSSLLFRGKIVLLISGQTSSAASEFAAITKYNRRATVIGEETGGCYYGATGGMYADVILPSSGVELRLPLVSIYNAVTEDYIRQPFGRGTIPDITVRNNITDILQNRDAVLKAALQE